MFRSPARGGGGGTHDMSPNLTFFPLTSSHKPRTDIPSDSDKTLPTSPRTQECIGPNTSSRRLATRSAEEGSNVDEWLSQQATERPPRLGLWKVDEAVMVLPEMADSELTTNSPEILAEVGGSPEYPRVTAVHCVGFFPPRKSIRGPLKEVKKLRIEGTRQNPVRCTLVELCQTFPALRELHLLWCVLEFPTNPLIALKNLETLTVEFCLGSWSWGWLPSMEALKHLTLDVVGPTTDATTVAAPHYFPNLKFLSLNGRIADRLEDIRGLPQLEVIRERVCFWPASGAAYRASQGVLDTLACIPANLRVELRKPGDSVDQLKLFYGTLPLRCREQLDVDYAEGRVSIRKRALEHSFNGDMSEMTSTGNSTPPLKRRRLE